MELAPLITHYRDALAQRYGARLSGGQIDALEAMLACRTSRYGETVFECTHCQHQQHGFQACGHRSCPRCQNHDTTVWLDRQRQKLLPVDYFLVTFTFTLPAELRGVAKTHPREVYKALFACASSTLSDFASNNTKLGGTLGMTAVLHTHSRRLDYHPHVHVVVPGGCVNPRRRQWRKLKGRYLFNEFALAKVFRARLLDALRQVGIALSENAPRKWVVDCQCVGQGEPALKYLSRYLYRGVISEANILADNGRQVSFRYTNSQTGETRTRRLDGETFLWLLLQHVLPKGFRRVRDYGFLNGKAKPLLRLIQQILQVSLALPALTARPAMHCALCDKPMRFVAFLPPAWRAG